MKEKQIGRTSGWSRPLLLSRFLLEVNVWGRSIAKTRANLAFGRTHRQLILVVIFKGEYMKKIIIFLLLINCSIIFAQDGFNSSELEWAGDIVKLNKQFIGYETTDIIQENEIIKLLDELWNVNDIRSIYLKHFLIYTHNQQIQNIVNNYIDTKGICDIYTEIIKNKYNMIQIEDNADNGKSYKYALNNEIFDEDINYILLIQNEYFDNELMLIYPWNKYNEIIIKDINTDQKVDNHDNKIFTYGRGTNTITIFFDKYVDHDLKKYEELLNSNHLYGRYTDLKRVIVTSYLFNNTSIVKAEILFGNGPDTYFTNSIQNGDIFLVIHESSGNTYRVNYFMNISTANNNYKVRIDIWRLLQLYCLMTLIN